MKSLNEKLLNLLILFLACMLGIVVSFLCIVLSIDILVWVLTGTFDLTKINVL